MPATFGPACALATCSQAHSNNPALEFFLQTQPLSYVGTDHSRSDSDRGYRQSAGLRLRRILEDPWGTRIEVVQDPELLGLHHIHMRGPNPDEVFSSLLAKFGGERTKLKGRIDAVKYTAAGFNDMWILVQRGDAEPSEDHAIDHIGWGAPRPLEQSTFVMS